MNTLKKIWLGLMLGLLTAANLPAQTAVSGHAADAGSVAPDAGGTVTSVGLALPASTFSVTGSPVTTSGTLTGAFTTQTANTVFSGPTTGSAAVPTWRALVPADIPAAVSTVAITDDTTTNATMYPTWVTAASGNLPIKVSSTKLSFNPSTGLLTLGGNLTFGTSASILNGTTGSIGLTATGTNQNITLTPSGTGGVKVGPNGSGESDLTIYSVSGANAGLRYATNGSTAVRVSHSVDSNGNWSLDMFNSGGSFLGTAIKIVNASRNTLLGGLTTDGTGVLQFPAATTSAGGITFGTDVNFFRVSAGALQMNGGVDTFFSLLASGGNQGTFGVDATGPYYYAGTGLGIRFRTNAGTTALTLDSSQRTILAGPYVGSTSTLTGAGAANVTTETTLLTTNGVAQAISLADGINGQRKKIVHAVDGGSAVLTPTTKTGFSTVTFTNAGETVTLQFYTTIGWTVEASYLAVVAP